jgi:hypothetical protein
LDTPRDDVLAPLTGVGPTADVSTTALLEAELDPDDEVDAPQAAAATLTAPTSTRAQILTGR